MCALCWHQRRRSWLFQSDKQAHPTLSVDGWAFDLGDRPFCTPCLMSAGGTSQVGHNSQSWPGLAIRAPLIAPLLLTPAPVFTGLGRYGVQLGNMWPPDHSPALQSFPFWDGCSHGCASRAARYHTVLVIALWTRQIGVHRRLVAKSADDVYILQRCPLAVRSRPCF